MGAGVKTILAVDMGGDIGSQLNGSSVVLGPKVQGRSLASGVLAFWVQFFKKKKLKKDPLRADQCENDLPCDLMGCINK